MHHIPENSNIHSQHSENLKFHSYPEAVERMMDGCIPSQPLLTYMNSPQYLFLVNVIVQLSMCEQNGYIIKGIIGKYSGGETITNDERCGED
jgi:hypothetical protein